MTIPELRRIAFAVAPELRGVRLEQCSDGWARPECRAFASTLTETIVFVEEPTTELLIHELAHLLPAAPVAAVEKSRLKFTPETETTIAASGGLGDFGMEMAVHGPQFVRNVLHLAYRARRWGFPVEMAELNAAGWQYAAPPLWQCRELLGDEPAQCEGLSFAKIHAMPLPEKFAEVFSGARSFYEGMRCTR